MHVSGRLGLSLMFNQLSFLCFSFLVFLFERVHLCVRFHGDKEGADHTHTEYISHVLLVQLLLVSGGSRGGIRQYVLPAVDVGSLFFTGLRYHSVKNFNIRLINIYIFDIK